MRAAFFPPRAASPQGLDPAAYEAKKEEVADEIVARLEAIIPGLKAATTFREVR
jgi:prolycopene isomerase